MGGDGSYFIDAKQVYAITMKAWMQTQLGIAEPFLWIEGASERYLPFVEVCNLSYGGVFGSDLEESEFIRVPMFQTVFNEYQRFGSSLPVNLPLPDPLEPIVMAASRHFLARYAHESGEVALGSVLSDSSLLDNMQNKDFALAIDMVTNFAALLKTTEARDLVRFGRRFRDPALVIPGPQAPNGSPPAGSGKAPSTGLPGCKDPVTGGPSYPAVYASASGKSGDQIALLLVNWTSIQDLCVSPALLGGAMPGTQRVTLTLDPEGYGFSMSDALKLTDVETGAETLLDWTGTGTLDVELQVPELSGRLMVLELQ